MTAMQIFNIAATAVIFVWSTWCVLSPSVNDGIIGKLIFSLAALSALGVMCGHIGEQSEGHRTSAALLNLSMALMGVRHVTMKYLWPRIVRAMRCIDCPKNVRVKQ